jgi:hypothetical protein
MHGFKIKKERKPYTKSIWILISGVTKHPIFCHIYSVSRNEYQFEKWVAKWWSIFGPFILLIPNFLLYFMDSKIKKERKSIEKYFNSYFRWHKTHYIWHAIFSLNIFNTLTNTFSKMVIFILQNIIYYLIYFIFYGFQNQKREKTYWKVFEFLF